MAGLNEHRQVNHSEAYQAEDGTNTNHVESFFSRIQRAYVGIHHRFSLKYFDYYVADLAWREDNRRKSNGQLTALVLFATMLNPTSRLLRLLAGEQPARSGLRGLRQALRARLRLRQRSPTGGDCRPACQRGGRVRPSEGHRGSKTGGSR
ncbi:MAG: transposase [Mesorhizobium sp.]|nr:MAG: transposase [Mesorhizobium sp.]TIS88385.1 MAG: transposase [Mesorhizobium sp.]